MGNSLFEVENKNMVTFMKDSYVLKVTWSRMVDALDLMLLPAEELWEERLKSGLILELRHLTATNLCCWTTLGSSYFMDSGSVLGLYVRLICFLLGRSRMKWLAKDRRAKAVKAFSRGSSSWPSVVFKSFR